jgi:hypothetical protein
MPVDWEVACVCIWEVAYVCSTTQKLGLQFLVELRVVFHSYFCFIRGRFSAITSNQKVHLWILLYPQTLRDCEESCQQQRSNTGNSLPPNTSNYIQKLHDEFETSMSDDLHTSVALAAISEPLKVMNDLLHTRKVNLLMNKWRYSSFVFRLCKLYHSLSSCKHQKLSNLFWPTPGI